MEWKGKFINNADGKLKTLLNKTYLKFHHKCMLRQNNPINTLNDVRNQFVVTPVNEANENFTFIYALFLSKKWA